MKFSKNPILNFHWRPNIIFKYYIICIKGLADLLKTGKHLPESQAARIESADLNEKLNLLAENVQSLLERNQTIDNEIETVKSNVESLFKGFATQIRQINVSLKNCLYKKVLIDYSGKSEWNIHICKFL